MCQHRCSHLWLQLFYRSCWVFVRVFLCYFYLLSILQVYLIISRLQWSLCHGLCYWVLFGIVMAEIAMCLTVSDVQKPVFVLFFRCFKTFFVFFCFYPRDAMLARVCKSNVSVCLSVRLSHAVIVSKRRKLASWFLHSLVAPRFWCYILCDFKLKSLRMLFLCWNTDLSLVYSSCLLKCCIVSIIVSWSLFEIFSAHCSSTTVIKYTFINNNVLCSFIMAMAPFYFDNT